MELQLLNKSYHHTLINWRKWLLLLASLGFTYYDAYKFYHLPSTASKRKRVFMLQGLLSSVPEALSHSADAMGLFSKDIKVFLHSESNKVLGSLKQVSKVTRSDEFCGSLASVTRSSTVGILRAKARRIDGGDVNASSPSFLDQVLEI